MNETPLHPPSPFNKHLTFRSSRIIYYGPHACLSCGVLICKMAQMFGGNAFTYPSGLIYPNTEWHPHVCDPKGTSGATQVPEPDHVAHSALRPPFETFKKPYCRGSYPLGSACGSCERCDWERAEMGRRSKS